MPKSDYDTSAGAGSSERAELVAVKEQLMAMDKTLRAERIARGETIANARAEILGLRRQLEGSVTPVPAPPKASQSTHSHVVLSLLAIAIVAAVAGFSAWYVDPLHTWEGHAAAVPLQQAVVSKPSLPPRTSPVSEETHAFSRLGDAVRQVPAPAMPAVFHAANDYLGATGEEGCSVDSPQGGLSLVVSGRGGDKPLLAALSRCAQAVEHLTQAPPGK